MILICGGLADRVTELVCARLAHCGYPYRLLDLARYPDGYQIQWDWQGAGLTGFIAGPDWRVDLEELTSVYIRFLGPEARISLPDIDSDLASAVQTEHDSGLMLLLEALPCLVVNRLGGSVSNNSKPYQALLVRRSGLRTPPTLVSNDPDAVLRFYEECGGNVIYKSLSGIRSIVRRLQPEQLPRLSLLQHGPAQFQAFVPGDDIRVHTVGERVFATRVRSQAVDYRYASRDGLDVEMAPETLPAHVAESCLRLARQLDLHLTGIDLKESHDGDYYCFEINPSPGFLYYEKSTGQPISTALADLLHQPHAAQQGGHDHGRRATQR